MAEPLLDELELLVIGVNPGVPYNGDPRGTDDRLREARRLIANHSNRAGCRRRGLPFNKPTGSPGSARA
jgi:hypothetical protein